jgi:beta-lactamase superfamily II metal-dependent hydrolase
VVVAAVTSSPDGRLHVTVLNVGEAPAVLVQAPDGAVALVDGGESASKLDAALSRVLPPTTRSLDLVVLTATNAVTINGDRALEQRYNVAQAVITTVPTPAAITMLTSYQSTGATVVDATGRSWTWHGLTWRSYPLDDGTSVISVASGSATALLLGSAGTDEQDDAIAGLGGTSRGGLIVTPPGGALESGILETVRPAFVAAPSSPASGSSGFIRRTGVDGDLRYATGDGGFVPG